MAELTYKALLSRVQTKEKTLTRNAEGVRKAADNIKELADDTASDANALGAKSVDPDSTSECSELSRIIRGTSDRAIAYAAKADDTAKSAKAAGDQARASHAGIQEAFDRATATVTNLERVSNDWLEQQ